MRCWILYPFRQLDHQYCDDDTYQLHRRVPLLMWQHDLAPCHWAFSYYSPAASTPDACSFAGDRNLINNILMNVLVKILVSATKAQKIISLVTWVHVANLDALLPVLHNKNDITNFVFRAAELNGCTLGLGLVELLLSDVFGKRPDNKSLAMLLDKMSFQTLPLTIENTLHRGIGNGNVVILNIVDPVRIACDFLAPRQRWWCRMGSINRCRQD